MPAVDILNVIRKVARQGSDAASGYQYCSNLLCFDTMAGISVQRGNVYRWTRTAVDITGLSGDNHCYLRSLLVSTHANNLVN